MVQVGDRLFRDAERKKQLMDSLRAEQEAELRAQATFKPRVNQRNPGSQSQIPVTDRL